MPGGSLPKTLAHSKAGVFSRNRVVPFRHHPLREPGHLCPGNGRRCQRPGRFSGSTLRRCHWRRRFPLWGGGGRSSFATFSAGAAFNLSLGLTSELDESEDDDPLMTGAGPEG